MTASIIGQARRVFDAGVLASGIPVEGAAASRDDDYAKRAFRRATELVPEMADAWLGRIMAGDKSTEAFFNLYKHRRSLLPVFWWAVEHPGRFSLRFNHYLPKITGWLAVLPLSLSA